MSGDNIRTVPISEEQQTELIQFAKDNQIDWTFVGPETPLIEGIVDAFQAAGLLIFGPTKAAAIMKVQKFCERFYAKIPDSNGGISGLSTFGTCLRIY